MTEEQQPQPDLDEAARNTEESLRQATRDKAQARARAKTRLTLAERIRRLREENGFEAIFREAFGGGGSG